MCLGASDTEAPVKLQIDRIILILNPAAFGLCETLLFVNKGGRTKGMFHRTSM